MCEVEGGRRAEHGAAARCKSELGQRARAISPDARAHPHDGFLLASHPRPVADDIERHRRAFDEDPATYLNANEGIVEPAVRSAAEKYLGAGVDEVAKRRGGLASAAAATGDPLPPPARSKPGPSTKRLPRRNSPRRRSLDHEERTSSTKRISAGHTATHVLRALAIRRHGRPTAAPGRRSSMPRPPHARRPYSTTEPGSAMAPTTR